MYIRNQSHALGHKLIARRKTKLLAQRKLRRLFLRSRKRLIRYSLLTANLALLVVVVFFVTKSSTGKQALSQSIAADPITAGAVVGPLDQVSSADIAVHVARVAGLPETVEVTNNADSIALAEATSEADTSVVAKPQIVATTLPTYKDIQQHTTTAGDTISAIAEKFGVSSDSIRWSNGLSGNAVPTGRTLFLPPAGTNGIVYTVAAGDTAESLAQRYSSDKDSITSFNDAEVSGLKPGQRILIPNGVVPAPVAAPRAAVSSYTYAGFAWGSNAIYGRNGYSYGYCTYYAASRVPVPANWGNADTWPRGARASGWTVSNTPRKGAVAWGAPIRMHVAYVEDVSPDGTMIKYSDMNNLAGWNRVGYSDWVPASYFPGYIYQ